MIAAASEIGNDPELGSPPRGAQGQCGETRGKRQNAIFSPGAERNESPVELGIYDVFIYRHGGYSSPLHLEPLRKPVCGCVFEGFTSRLLHTSVASPSLSPCMHLLKPGAETYLSFLISLGILP